MTATAPAVAIEWAAPATCPSREEFEAKVASVLRPGAEDVAASVTIFDVPSGVDVLIKWTGARREFYATTCAEAVDAAALILSLGDPTATSAASDNAAPAAAQEAQTGGPAPAPIPAAAPSSSAPPASVAPKTTTSERAPASRSPSLLQRSRPGTSVFLRPFFDGGSLAEPSLGLSIGASRAIAFVELGVAIEGAAGLGDATDASGHGGRFDLLAGAVEGFLPLRAADRFAIGPVIGAEVGVLFAKGTSIDVASATTRAWVAATASGRARFDLSDRFALTLDAGFALPFDRPSFYFDPSSTNFAHVPAIAFRGGIGIAVRFP